MIIFTNHEDPRLQGLALARGADAYLVKVEVLPRKLLRRIDSLLNAHHTSHLLADAS